MLRQLIYESRISVFRSIGDNRGNIVFSYKQQIEKLHTEELFLMPNLLQFLCGIWILIDVIRQHRFRYGSTFHPFVHCGIKIQK